MLLFSIKMIKDKYQKFLYFTIFSSIAAIIQIGAFTVLFELFLMRYWRAYIISVIVMVLFNTAMNRKYTFQSSIKFRLVVFKLSIFYVVFIPVFSIGGDGLVELGWSEYLVLLLSMIVNLILAFFYNKIFIYQRYQNRILQSDK